MDLMGLGHTLIMPPTLRSNRFGLKVAVGCVMRGRYTSANKTEQKIEINNEEICNSITTVQKDSMVVEVMN